MVSAAGNFVSAVHDQFVGSRRLTPRGRTARTAAFAILLVLAARAGASAQPDERAITCTNPYSGASWQIHIDYEHGTVDANPARVSDDEIAWHDARDGGNYTLDRSSGKLAVVLPSSTGGFFLHDQCDLKN